MADKPATQRFLENKSAREVTPIPNSNSGFIGIIPNPRGGFSLCAVYQTVTRQLTPKLIVHIKDFGTLGEAEDLYLKFFEANGGLAFGDTISITKSGIRLQQENTGKVVRLSR